MVGQSSDAPGERGPSWRYSNTGGASAAFRHRPTRKQGLQGLRFAPGGVGRRAECRVSAGVCGIVGNEESANLGAYPVRRFAPWLHEHGQGRKPSAGNGLQPILWLGCRNRPTSLCARSDASDTAPRNSLYACVRASRVVTTTCVRCVRCAGVPARAFSIWTPLAVDHTTRYTRSPLPLCASTTFRPSFLRSIPDIAPRTVCGCQPVASISCRLVAP